MTCVHVPARKIAHKTVTCVCVPVPAQWNTERELSYAPCSCSSKLHKHRKDKTSQKCQYKWSTRATLITHLLVHKQTCQFNSTANSENFHKEKAKMWHSTDNYNKHTCSTNTWQIKKLFCQWIYLALQATEKLRQNRQQENATEMTMVHTVQKKTCFSYQHQLQQG